MANDATSDLYWAIGIFILLGVMWFTGGGPERATDQTSLEPDQPAKESPAIEPVFTAPTPVDTAEPNQAEFSSYAGDFRISRGNAGRVIQPREEHIIIDYTRRADGPVNITGWTVENSPFRGGRQVAIGQGTLLLTPEPVDRVNVDIVLNPGDRAVITTGRMPQVGPVRIDRSFKVNNCLGYLVQTGRYNFLPSIRTQCPRPANEPEVATLSDSCYDFVRRLRPCHTPIFDQDDDYQDTVDGVVGLSASCQAFIKERFNYAGCVEAHWAQADFWRPEWRIFLGEVWPLWASNREVITLRDGEGKIVEQLSY